MKPPEFMKKRNSNMTLEKLLIFGFALAVLMAISTMGSNMWTDRKNKDQQFQGTIDSIN